MRGAVALWLMLPLALASRGQRPAVDSPATRSDTVVTGQWGGTHIVLEATDSGGAVEYDCGHGRITEPLRVDEDGSFRAHGTHSPEHGGPVGKGERGISRAAIYAGKVTGTRMKLTVTLADPAETLGTFDLVRDAEGELVKCR